ncbi:MAG: pyridoxamine 5'-phosphate oxidase family protein [SAR324 cluster bacterium]|nr:pyridoxamine 5'-phosphate oxidase family protein [SAR324 cluster bacterium]MBL7035348.1 pyridoxamine 5'-phosphate oxidase family protein [SAR324 cluster bacterium]
MKSLSTPLAKTKAEYSKFLLNYKSLYLSTVGKNGAPNSSYAPFVMDENKQFYLYISALAGHTANLLNDGRAGIMLIETEEQAENVFARKRVTFECDVEVLKRDSSDWQKIMNKFDESVGELMQTLRMLQDFYLIRLLPKSGLFVKGFGKAFKISGKRMDVLSHLNPGK